MTKEDFKIGSLSLVAMMLFLTIVITTSMHVPGAQAASGMSQAGPYTLFVGQAGVGFSHVYVIHGKKDKLLTYRLEQGTGAIKLTDVIDLGGGNDTKNKGGMKP